MVAKQKINPQTTLVMVVSLWVFWCCLVGVGKISWLGSSFFVFFRMLVWLTSQGYPSQCHQAKNFWYLSG